MLRSKHNSHERETCAVDQWKTPSTRRLTRRTQTKTYKQRNRQVGQSEGGDTPATHSTESHTTLQCNKGRWSHIGQQPRPTTELVERRWSRLRAIDISMLVLHVTVGLEGSAVGPNLKREGAEVHKSHEMCNIDTIRRGAGRGLQGRRFLWARLAALAALPARLRSRLGQSGRHHRGCYGTT